MYLQAQPESGFDSFLEQAQGVLAGAIKSGAAEKLLSGFFSSGQPQQQGYAPQNAVSKFRKGKNFAIKISKASQIDVYVSINGSLKFDCNIFM